MIPDPSERRAGGAPAVRPSPYLLPAEPGEFAIHGYTRGAKSVAQELLEAVLLSVVIFFLVQMAIQNRVVLGQSMEPTLRNDERLFIDRVSYLRIDAGLLGGGGPSHEIWLARWSATGRHRRVSPARGGREGRLYQACHRGSG